MIDNSLQTTSVDVQGTGFEAMLAKVQSVQQLADCMKKLLQMGEGTIPLRALQEWGIGHARPLPKSTVHDVLTAQRPPNPKLLLNFLAACHVRDEPEIGLWFSALDRVLASRPTSRRRNSDEQGLGTIRPSQFFVEQDNLDETRRWIQALDDELWLWGTTLSMHLAYLEPYIKQALANECRVKVLLVTPSGIALDMAAFRAGPGNNSKEEHRERLEINLRILRRIASQAPGLEVRLIDFLAPYTLYAYDPGLTEGRMCIRLASFHGKYEMRPTFYLQRERDEGWFDYFYEQFASVWNSAESADGIAISSNCG